MSAKPKVLRSVAYYVGQIICRNEYRPNHVKVRCNRMKLDERLLMYFPKRFDKWAVHDTNTPADLGDIVLIEDQCTRLSPIATYFVKELVYKVGAVTDPITGKTVRGTQFIDEEARKREIEQRTAGK